MQLSCPHCQQLIDLDKTPSPTTAVCPRCGRPLWLRPQLNKVAIDSVFTGGSPRDAGHSSPTSPTPAKARSQPVNQSHAIQFNIQGAYLSRRGRYREAIKEFTEAIGHDPRFAKAFNNRG